VATAGLPYGFKKKITILKKVNCKTWNMEWNGMEWNGTIHI